MGTTVRSSSRNPSNRGFSSHRIFLSAILTLLFIATLSAFLTSTAPNQDPIDTSLHNRPSLDPGPVRTYVSRTFLALKSDPLRTRLDLIYKQASDHIALVNAYGAYARKLKLDNSKQLKIFEDLADNFSDLDEKSPYKRSLIETDGPIDEDVLRQYEKEVKDRIKTARQVIAEAKESFDNQIKIQKLKDTIFAVNEQLAKAKKHGTVSSLISARSIPKSLHCLAMRLVEERATHPEKYSPALPPEDEFEDPSLFHYAIFSNNVIATSVVVNSAARNAEEPGKHVFHVVTDRMYLAAMQVWFKMRPAEGGAHVEVKAVEDFSFLNASYVPVIRQLEAAAESDEVAAVQGSPVHVSMLEYLRFYLPEMYPKLRRILLLDDDVVVQRDLTGLWRMDMDGKVNGAVETCFGSFHRYSHYLNFSHPKVRERFNPKACAWAYGMNLFDLDAWRGEECTEEYHYWQKLALEGEAAEGGSGVSEDAKKESIMRLSWGLVHSKRPEDVQRGIAMLESSLNSSSSPTEKREKLYLLAVGHYRSGDYSRSRQLVERCLEIAPDWRQGLTLKKVIEDKIAQDGLIGIGIAATAVGLLVGGIAAAVSRKK